MKRSTIILAALCALALASASLACTSSSSSSPPIEAANATSIELRALFCMGGHACGVERTSYKLDLQSGKLETAACTEDDAGATRKSDSAVLSAEELASVRQTLSRMEVSSDFVTEYDGPMTTLVVATATGKQQYADAQRCNNDPSALRVTAKDLGALQTTFAAALAR